MSATNDSPLLSRAVRIQAAGLLVALITAGAFISVPVPVSPVPIVLQNMFVVLAGLVLSPRWAALSVGVYLLLGAVGLPVFAGATGGLARFLGPTGGFLVAYPLSAFLASAIARGNLPNATPPDQPVWRVCTAVFVGFSIVYLSGVPWLAVSTGMSVQQAIIVGMVPFLFGDLLKAGLLIVLVYRLPGVVWRAFR